MNKSLIITSVLRHFACRGFCCCSVTKSYLTLWDSMDSSTPGFSVLHFLLLLKFMSIESVMLSNHLILCCPLLLLLWLFPRIRVFSNELLASGGQSIEASALATVLPMNTQGWFLLGLIDLISLLSKGLSSVFPRTTIWKHQYPSLYGPTLHIYVVHWRREWQTTSVFLPWEPHEQYEKAKW